MYKQCWYWLSTLFSLSLMSRDWFLDIPMGMLLTPIPYLTSKEQTRWWSLHAPRWAHSQLCVIVGSSGTGTTIWWPLLWTTTSLSIEVRLWREDLLLSAETWPLLPKAGTGTMLPPNSFSTHQKAKRTLTEYNEKQKMSWSYDPRQPQHDVADCSRYGLWTTVGKRDIRTQ